MGQYRLTEPAKDDTRRILSTSRDRWGLEASRRYGDLLFAAVLKAADDPLGRLTDDESHLSKGLRSLHVRFAGPAKMKAVRRPVHVIYYRELEAGMVLIVRILHERMDPQRHVAIETRD